MTERPYAILGPDGQPVNAQRYASLTEATMALLFEYAPELEYRPGFAPPDPAPTPPIEDTTR